MVRKRIAIVTGASSGLGKEFVKIFLKKRSVEEIWVVARNKNKLSSLKKLYGKKIRVIPADLSKIDEIKKLHRILKSEDPNILYLVNSAGFAKFGAYNDISVKETINMIDLNISGVVAMCLACIPFMEKGSHIMNISSQAAFQPLPYQNVYSSTKAFIRNYSRALNVELMDKGIGVTAVCPGWMDTALYARAETGAFKSPNNFVGIVFPKDVAAKALKDAKKGKDMSVYSTYVNLCHVASKLLPQRTMMKLWLIQQNMD